MARQVAGSNAAAAQQPQVPDGIAIDNIPEDMPAEIAGETPQEGQSGETPYKYIPSAKTIEKIDAFPYWDQVKERFGIDIVKLKAETNKYGVLEGLAYGSFTTEPLRLRIRMPNQKSVSGFFTVRLFTNPTTGDWGIETHKVGLKYAKDKDGQFIQKPDGKYKMTFDRNRLEEGDVVQYNGEFLTKEDVDHLRLTGTLGRLFESTDFNGKTTISVLCVDPYNNHEVVALSSDVIARRLSTANGRIFKDNGLVYELSLKDAGELAHGHIVEVSAKDKPDSHVFLKYDTAAGKLVKTVTYEYALKRELERKEKEEIAKKAGVGQAQSQGRAQSR